MNKFVTALVLLAGGLMTSGGCATPAYSGHERFQMISRNINFEGAQAMDDMDSLLLLRPAGRLTIWHIR